MSNLSETVSFKVSKEMKTFLDNTENSSDYLRQLIFQNMRIRNRVKDISSLENVDGEVLYTYDEDEINKLVQDEVVKTVVCHIINETKIVLKK